MHGTEKVNIKPNLSTILSKKFFFLVQKNVNVNKSVSGVALLYIFLPTFSPSFVSRFKDQRQFYSILDKTHKLIKNERVANSLGQP